jgi:hypothetical protein
VSTDICSHCSYRIPGQASICPGCGRRHGVPAPRIEEHPLRRSPLLRDAQWTRRFVAVAGWLGLGLALTAIARAVAGIDRVAEELAGDAQLRLDHAGRLLALAALLALTLAATAAAVWVARTMRNTRALGLPPALTSPWSLPGWLLPGRSARRAKADVDQVWRDRSPLVGALHHRGSSRRIVSRVVLRWWSLWLWLPATVTLIALVAHADDGALHDERGLAAVAAGALLVATARAYYDVVGIITVAHAHQGEEVARDRAELPWVDAPLDTDEPLSEPLAR